MPRPATNILTTQRCNTKTTIFLNQRKWLFFFVFMLRMLPPSRCSVAVAAFGLSLALRAALSAASPRALGLYRGGCSRRDGCAVFTCRASLDPSALQTVKTSLLPFATLVIKPKNRIIKPKNRTTVFQYIFVSLWWMRIEGNAGERPLNVVQSFKHVKGDIPRCRLFLS